VLIRRKVEADTDACHRLLLAVHATDGYPAVMPPDPRRFMTPRREYVGWVAEQDGEIVGHVALHEASNNPMTPLACEESGLAAEQLCALARLVVGPTVRRQGLARRLLELATAHALGVGRRPILDVAQGAAAPIALYESAGWQRVGRLTLELGDDRLDVWIYLGPDVEPAAEAQASAMPSVEAQASASRRPNRR
jgi:GNAT superfamily N-acetyltransferase